MTPWAVQQFESFRFKPIQFGDVMSFRKGFALLAPQSGAGRRRQLWQWFASRGESAGRRGVCLGVAAVEAAPHRGWQWALMILVVAGLVACAQLPREVDRVPSRALADPGDTALGRLAERRRPDGLPGDRSGFALLASPDAAFAARLALAEQARQTLDIQYYLIHADPSATRLLEVVQEAAARGVRVRILLDDLHTVGRDALVMAMDEIPGVELRMFNPLPGSRKLGSLRTLGALYDFDRIQRRMHNKLFIADNAWAITGGRNLGDAYFGTAGSSDYIDLDLLAAGPVVRELSASFDRYWEHELAYPASALTTPRQLQNIRDTIPPHEDPSVVEPVHALPPAADLVALPLHWASVRAMADDPDKLLPGRHAGNDGAVDEVLQGVLAQLDSAQHDVLVATPYFVPGKEMLSSFASLQEREVAVQVLTNSLSSTTALLAQVGYARHRKRLLTLGLDLREMHANEPARLRQTALGSGNGGAHTSLHAKLMVVDRRALIIGSMNMDLRSKLQNTEVALLVDHAALAQEVISEVRSVMNVSAWKVELSNDGQLYWRAPPAADFEDARHEPDASAWLRLLSMLLAPFVPDELL